MEYKKRNTVLTKKPFKPGYNSLPAKEQKGVRESLMTLCGWTSYGTFLNKKDGKVPIRPPEVEIVENVFK